MRRYWLLTGGMVVAFLALFGVVEASGVPLLTDPEPWLRGGGAGAAATGVGLLLVDVLLPVPSSLVMVVHGALFGVVGGAALSLVGSVGAAALAFAIGRAGGPLVHRLAGDAESARADALLERWGAVAIVATRPVPVLAETTAILAGTSPLGWGALLVAATVGNLVPALLYALTGAAAADLGDAFAVFGLVLVVTGVFWFLARRLRPSAQDAS